MSESYDLIIIDPDLGSRGQLKQAAHNDVAFGRVYPSGTLQEALERLNMHERCDIIFISFKFEQDNIIEFIAQAKQTPVGAECAYILVLRPKEQSSAIVAGNVMVGVDGFLFEPYSVDSIREMSVIAAKVKLENERKRERAALQLLLYDIVRQLDYIATAKHFETVFGRTMRELKQACSILTKLGPESLAMYYELCEEAFTNAQVPQLRKATTASKRVKKKVVAQLDDNGKGLG